MTFDARSRADQTSIGEERSPRQKWMAVIARASASELEAIIARHGGIPDHVVLKPVEVGTVMIEGRAGGTGARFNAGEATVTRSVIRLANGNLGFSLALGTDRRKALLAAILDACLQIAPSGKGLHAEIDALSVQQAAARDLASRKAARTKVEFFTMVRGAD